MLFYNASTGTCINNWRNKPDFTMWRFLCDLLLIVGKLGPIVTIEVEVLDRLNLIFWAYVIHFHIVILYIKRILFNLFWNFPPCGIMYCNAKSWNNYSVISFLILTNSLYAPLWLLCVCTLFDSLWFTLVVTKTFTIYDIIKMHST